MKHVTLALALSAGLVLPAIARDDTPTTPTTAAAPTTQKSTPAGGSLTVGDKAPAIAIKKWVKGNAVPSFENGKVYVVEFWATWCGPCKKSMPHLTQLQMEYGSKGVTIIGVTTQDPRNSLEDVEKMTREKGTTMGYTVAWDDGRKTTDAYMTAAAQPGIPTAFIVNQNQTIAWIGSPFEMDEPLEKIVKGAWDIDAARSKFQQEQAIDIAQVEFSKAGKAKDTAAMLASANKLVETAPDNADIMNYVSWGIVDPKRAIDFKANPKLLDVAFAAATKANTATKNADPSMLDTLAHCQFAKGDAAAAIKTEELALTLVKDEESRKELEATLKMFKGTK